MKPVHLEIVQGTPFQFIVHVKYRDEEGELVPYPLIGCSAKLQARVAPGRDTVLSLSSADGSITIDEEAGDFLVSMDSAETRAITWPVKTSTSGRVPFQCEVIPPDGESFRVLEGTLRLNRGLIQ